jgi:hypothetical protein
MSLYGEATEAPPICEQRRREIHPDPARVEEVRFLFLLVSLVVHRSGWLRDTIENRYRRIPSPRKNPPTPRNRTNAIGRVQNKHKTSTNKPRISRIPENCSRRSSALGLSITGRPSRTSSL